MAFKIRFSLLWILTAVRAFDLYPINITSLTFETVDHCYLKTVVEFESALQGNFSLIVSQENEKELILPYSCSFSAELKKGRCTCPSYYGQGQNTSFEVSIEGLGSRRVSRPYTKTIWLSEVYGSVTSLTVVDCQQNSVSLRWPNILQCGHAYAAREYQLRLCFVVSSRPCLYYNKIVQDMRSKVMYYQIGELSRYTNYSVQVRYRLNYPFEPYDWSSWSNATLFRTKGLIPVQAQVVKNCSLVNRSVSLTWKVSREFPLQEIEHVRVTLKVGYHTLQTDRKFDVANESVLSYTVPLGEVNGRVLVSFSICSSEACSPSTPSCILEKPVLDGMHGLSSLGNELIVVVTVAPLTGLIFIAAISLVAWFAYKKKSYGRTFFLEDGRSSSMILPRPDEHGSGMELEHVSSPTYDRSRQDCS